MTLQQAHELQRLELISLRAEVARLKKQTTGLFLVEEKEALERRIRHLEQVNKLTDKYISILELAANEYEKIHQPKITWMDLIFKKDYVNIKMTIYTFSNILMLTIRTTSVNEN